MVDLAIGRADEVVNVERSDSDTGQLLVADYEDQRGCIGEASEHGPRSSPWVDLGQSHGGGDVVAELDADAKAIEPHHDVGSDDLALRGSVGDRLRSRAKLADDVGPDGVAGPTGAGKSELAALVQRHFGPGLDARHLPGSWSSTANALELLAFSAKDALLVIDDFAPGGQSGDVDRAHRDADRVLRAQGNRAGRLRMRADGTLRAARPPRGLILSTGEDVPRGQSIRARLLACELGPDDLRWAALSASQKDAAEGRLAQALSGFVCWIAPQRQSLQAELRAWLPELRETAATSATHRRTPDIVANLAAGWSYFLSFATHAGAVTEAERGQLWSRAWDALGRAASAQSSHQRGTEPAQRFLELLASAIGSGRAHLAGPDGNRPSDGAWGWRQNQRGDWEPKGERIGWLVDGDHVYLDADASYAVVQRLGQEVGDRLPVTPQTLRKRLKERGVLVSTDTARQVLTVRRVLEGQRREVLHLSGTILSPSEPP